MDIKHKAYELFQQGTSYKEIALKLNIGKTTAYDYVKEVKLLKSASNTTGIVVPNSSELVRNGNSERNTGIEKSPNAKIIKNPEILNKINIPNVPTKSKIKVITGDDLLKMKFDVLPFTGKFLDLIGKPERGFSGIVFGKPKEGKSNFAIRFADYLQEYFGKTVYVAAEEGNSLTLQEKIREIKGSKITFIETRNREDLRDFLKSSKVDFVFIDSINTLNIDDEFLELIKHENPNVSFVAIIQATKEGNFKGAQSLEHNCDFVIRVEKGIAHHRGRFGPESSLNIFEDALYIKNVNYKSKSIDHIEKSLPPLPEFKFNDKRAKTDKPSDFVLDFTTSNNIEGTNLGGAEKIFINLKQIPKPIYRRQEFQPTNGLSKFVSLFVAGLLIIKSLDSE
jgi:hypothetical protein